jgi:hypothetical protein
MGLLITAALPPWGIGRENCKSKKSQLVTTLSTSLYESTKQSQVDTWKYFNPRIQEQVMK